MIEIFDTKDFIDFIDSDVNLEFGDMQNNKITMQLNINDKLIKLEDKGILNLNSEQVEMVKVQPMYNQ